MQETTFNEYSEYNDSYLSLEIHQYIKVNAQLNTNKLLDFITNSTHIDQFLKKLNYRFSSTSLFINSLIHKSFCNEFSSFGLESNQRLEYLGDSVLDLIIAQQLFDKYPKFQEGKLSKFRSALVNEKSLEILARQIGLDKVLILGKGEIIGRGFDKPSLLSDTFEALLAAIYKDSDIETTTRIFNHILEIYKSKYCMDFIHLDRLDEFDPKTRLQELLVSLNKGLPQYDVLPLDNQSFKIDLLIGGKFILSMEGERKKDIEKKLAYKVLKKKLYE